MSWDTYSSRTRHHPYAGGYPNPYVQPRAIAAPVPPVTAPPAVPNILHWFDFTDTTVMWQDVAATIPANAFGHAVARVDNKGSGPHNISTTIAARRPILDNVSSAPIALAANFDAVNHVLGVIITAGLTGDLTWAIVAQYDPASSIGNTMIWGASAEMRSRDNTVLRTIMEGSGTHTGVNAVVADTWWSALRMHDSVSPQQETFFNRDSGSQISANAHINQSASNPLAFGSSGIIPNPGQMHNGLIGEGLIWNRLLTTPEVNTWKAYTANKYGITWA